MNETTTELDSILSRLSGLSFREKQMLNNGEYAELDRHLARKRAGTLRWMWAFVAFIVVSGAFFTIESAIDYKGYDLFAAVAYGTIFPALAALWVDKRRRLAEVIQEARRVISAVNSVQQA